MDIEKNSIIVSVQSTAGDPTHNKECKEAFIKSAIIGGAGGLRLAAEYDIKKAKMLYPEIPVIGITKPDIIPKNYKELVYITPTPEDALKLIEWGADIVAFDGTKRHNYKPIIEAVKNASRLAMADISTYEEGIAAQGAGADIISTTLSGYTTYSKQSDEPDFELLEKLVKNVNCPVILEGKIWEHGQVGHFQLI
jgi:N-acylglucosamine-6-phosphate 2-epimerase